MAHNGHLYQTSNATLTKTAFNDHCLCPNNSHRTCWPALALQVKREKKDCLNRSPSANELGHLSLLLLALTEHPSTDRGTRDRCGTFSAPANIHRHRCYGTRRRMLLLDGADLHLLLLSPAVQRRWQKFMKMSPELHLRQASIFFPPSVVKSNRWRFFALGSCKISSFGSENPFAPPPSASKSAEEHQQHPSSDTMFNISDFSPADDTDLIYFKSSFLVTQMNLHLNSSAGRD